MVKTAIAGMAKACSALLSVVLTVIVTRTLGPEESGYFLLGVSILSVLAVVFRLGLDNVILRLFGAHGIEATSQNTLNRGIQWILIAVIPFTLLIMQSSQQIADVVFSKPKFGETLFWIIVALPPITIFMLIANAFQGLHRVFISTCFQNLGLSGLFVFAFFFIQSNDSGWLTSAHATQVYVASAWVIFFFACLLWFCQNGVFFRLLPLRDTQLWSSSTNLLSATSMSLAVQWAGILIAGSIVESNELAFLSAAQRTAGLASFALIVVNAVVAPRYARLWHEGNINEMKNLAIRSTRGMIIVVLPVVCVMVFFPELVMPYFGEGFERGAPLLSIMALGQFVNLATGSVGYLLNMSGHERDFRRVTFFSGPLAIVLALVLTWRWGVLGAAIATSVGLSIQNLGAMWMVKKRLGFWSIG